MPRLLLAIALVAPAPLLSAPPAAAVTAMPPGFENEVVWSGFDRPVALAFAPNGPEVFVAEKGGRIYSFDDVDSTTPHLFADFRSVVYGGFDRGLLGLAIDPEFPTVPYVYVLYTYDGPIGGPAGLWNDGCPTPPGPSTDGCPVSGRLSRLTAGLGAGGAWTMLSEELMIEGWCQQYMGHTIGDLQFGASGALYATAGEGAAYTFLDYGQGGGSPGSPVQKNHCGDPPGGVGGSMTVPTARGGSLRAQSPRRPSGEPVLLNGSILRLDPATGTALPDNPWAGKSDENARRIVGYGFRNPYRFAIRPGTDELWVGDVGASLWEEIDVVPDPTAGSVRNFGWPCYEGTNKRGTFDTMTMCTDLYADTTDPMTPAFWRYKHADKVVPGEACPTGSSAISGLRFYEGGNYPPQYDGALFFADHPRTCIWAMLAGADGLPDPNQIVTLVSDAASRPVDLDLGPGGDLFYVGVADGTIHRIRYHGSNPIAAAAADATYGGLPLTVSFDGSGSTDPDPEDTLTYEWDLDGDTEYDDRTGPLVTWTYEEELNVSARLRVTDQRGAFDESDPISLFPGDTPPRPVIDLPAGDPGWAVGDVIDFAGGATDDEEGGLPAEQLTWHLLHQHCPSNCHEHDLETWTGIDEGSFTTSGHEYPSYLELQLTATDARGMSATTSVDLHPRTAEIVVETSPPGLNVALNGETGSSPLQRTAIVGSENTVTAPSPQTLGGVEYGFASWSDGGTQTHAVVVPESGQSVTAAFEALPPPPTGTLFSDGFETGDLSKWTASRSFGVQGAETYAGAWAGRATGAGTASWVSKSIAPGVPELYLRSRVKIVSQGANGVTLLGLRTSTGAALASVNATAAGKLTLYSGVAAKTITSTTSISKGVWHELELHGRIAGAASTVDVWLDGVPVAALSKTLSLGVAPIGQVRLGEQNTGRSFDVAFDEVAASITRP
jgi:glucose/arabinose dehydrogenase